MTQEKLDKIIEEYHLDKSDLSRQALKLAYHQGILAAKECVPKEATEADGWEIVHGYSCCPGDDAASGYNTCRTIVLSSLDTLLAENKMC